jgi:glutamate/tyrosine decarboxylase-like PLP-dependent enzyme
MGHLEGWFLGPKAENQALFQGLIQAAIEHHCQTRKAYFPGDPLHITAAMQRSPQYQETLEQLKRHYQDLLAQLAGSIPFWSYRWQAHMSWDQTLPSLLGYFAAMLYNPNNVAAEVSPVTTQLELKVGQDLCQLLGYRIPEPDDPSAIHPWGHLTSGGSVANLEALWAARNLKYYPVTIAQALKQEPRLKVAHSLEVTLPTGQVAPLVDLENWQLLNLEVDEILGLAPRITQDYGIDKSDLSDLLKPYTLQHLGLIEFYQRFLPQTAPPVILVPGTGHYSWPKGAAILGIGQQQVKRVAVDRSARLDPQDLQSVLQDCLKNQCPIVMTVVILGSTVEGAVDPVTAVLDLRQQFRRRGLEFAIHADAAWGGYFASLLWGEFPVEPDLDNTPLLPLSDYVSKQFQSLHQVESITIDPHKAGYIPKPAGGLCYRNGAMRDLVTLKAPVIYHGDNDPALGIYGIEGSKPGAVAAGVYLSHRVIPLDRGGYGKILSKCLFNSKRFYAALRTMAEDHDPFRVMPLHLLPTEKAGSSLTEIEDELALIREKIVPKTNGELRADPVLMEQLQQLGGDQTIVPYAFNFQHNGIWNRSLERANFLNQHIFSTLSLSEPQGAGVPKVPMIVTASQFEPQAYGQAFVDAFCRRLGLEPEIDQPVHFLITTTTNPWLTDTKTGNFIPQLIQVLRHTVLSLIAELNSL